MDCVKIKDKILQIPIIQGGMGVGVSLSKLAGSVMKTGALGVISSAHPGHNKDEFLKAPNETNYKELINHLKIAREISEGNGLLGVNVMVALEDYENMVKASLEGGADVIISGAGIPMTLPSLTKGYKDVALAPIVSSAKVARLLCKKWDRSYNCIPDLIIIEGPLAGGHLGFSVEEIEKNIDLDDILFDVLEIIKPYEEKYCRKIPVFVAGGIYDADDLYRVIQKGASGVQIGTRFIATYEADCSIEFKNAIVESKEEDIVLVKSPVGMPGRALLTPLTKRLLIEDIPVKRCYNCLIPCNPATTDYCISEALIQSAKGNHEEGLHFCGSNAYKVDKIVHVNDIISELVDGFDKLTLINK